MANVTIDVQFLAGAGNQIMLHATLPTNISTNQSQSVVGGKARVILQADMSIECQVVSLECAKFAIHFTQFQSDVHATESCIAAKEAPVPIRTGDIDQRLFHAERLVRGHRQIAIDVPQCFIRCGADSSGFTFAKQTRRKVAGIKIFQRCATTVDRYVLSRRQTQAAIVAGVGIDLDG